MKNADRIKFGKIGNAGEERLQGRTVAIAGLGSVGSSLTAMLAREGIDLRLIDMGRVEESNMHRLALFQEEDITKFKVKQAKLRVAAINPAVQVKSFHEEIISSNVFLLEGDVIVDATSDDKVNAMVLAHAAKKKLPLVMVRVSGSDVRVLVLQKPGAASLAGKLKLPDSGKAGSFGPATHFGASIAAAEILKLLVGDKGSRLIEASAWDLKLKVTKL